MKGKSFLSVMLVCLMLVGISTASASITMYGLGDGAVSYDSMTDIYQYNGVIGNTMRISDLFGWGAMEFAYLNEINAGGISGYIGADLYSGRLGVSDLGLITGSGNVNKSPEDVICVFNETEDDEYCEYCTYMESGSTAVLDGSGTTLSQMTLTPVYPYGGIDHYTTMRGNGSFSGESAYDGYLDVNDTESSISIVADRFSFEGTNLSVSRHVVFQSEHNFR